LGDLVDFYSSEKTNQNIEDSPPHEERGRGRRGGWYRGRGRGRGRTYNRGKDLYIPSYIQMKVQQKLETPEQILQFREERRSRYPTKENIQQKFEERQQRIERGELLDLPNINIPTQNNPPRRHNNYMHHHYHRGRGNYRSFNHRSEYPTQIKSDDNTLNSNPVPLQSNKMEQSSMQTDTNLLEPISDHLTDSAPPVLKENLPIPEEQEGNSKQNFMVNNSTPNDPNIPIPDSDNRHQEFFIEGKG